MNHLERLLNQITLRLSWLFGLSSASLVTVWVLLDRYTTLPDLVLILIMLLLAGFVGVAVSMLAARLALSPLKMVWQAILHVSPNEHQMPPPNMDDLKLGRELVSALSLQVYQLAGGVKSEGDEATRTLAQSSAAVLDTFPLPVFAIDQEGNILMTNEAAATYCQSKLEELSGKNIYSLLDLSFPSQDTLDSWLQRCREQKVTDQKSWERVRLNQEASDQPKTVKQFDMAASYSKDHPSGIEAVITIFDRTSAYNEEDQGLSFIALAVHELRTPLTALRGYIEVFEDELSEKLDGELADFMHKMHASAEQLTSFVNNILNVARVEENQLILDLTKQSWDKLLKSAVDDMQLRANVHQKTIELVAAKDLPPVAVDQVSIAEVVYNLLDNAIKYSGEGPKKIVVRSVVGKDGLVETTIQDYGVGIPTSVLPHLFDKFYRNHRTRAQIGGTGLGLYLAKAVITAHGGNIWVQSKEGEGATFGFTVQPYSMLAEELKNSDNKGITRGAYGWIKNHSLYRR